ncbi:hypothetical protein [Winogradskyella sp.]|uniref:hypothetical protein n=1 Tax=Winogradskyella sp. TaxID=1883156 RepID=UPI003BAAAA81
MLWKNKNKFKVKSIKKVDLSGYMVKYGITQEGILYAIIAKEGDQNRYYQELIGISVDGKILWHSALKIGYHSELRISKDGHCFIGFSNEIHKIDKNGTSETFITIAIDSDQEIGSFAILDDAFIICIHGKKRPNSKVLKVDLKGQIIWETPIPVNGISYEGVMEMRADNNWKAERKKDWSPENWLCLYNNEIIISDDSILVSYFEMPRSGIGKSYILDSKTGKIKWDSKPAPFESISCIGKGMFLLGHQGYGAFDTELISSEGELIDKWKSVGKTVVSKHKEIGLIEMDNSSASELYHSKLMGNGEVIRGSKIEGYYIIDPVLDHYGNMIFWRNNELTVIDSKSKKHNLLRKAFEKEPTTSRRILLFDEGQLIFSLNKELYILDTTLGFLDSGSWPCKFGNNERNPVID